MINANELRIGNWVQTIIDKNKFQIRDGEDIDDLGNTDTYEPIPLTPKILKSCGFDREFKFFERSHIILLEMGDIYYYYYNSVTDDRAELKYLHQLQNLYLILTGDELSVNIKHNSLFI